MCQIRFLRTLYAIINPHNFLGTYYHYPYFTDEEDETQHIKKVFWSHPVSGRTEFILGPMKPRGPLPRVDPRSHTIQLKASVLLAKKHRISRAHTCMHRPTQTRTVHAPGSQDAEPQSGPYLPAVFAEHRGAAQEAQHLPTEQTLGEAVPHHVPPHGLQPLHQPPAAQDTESEGMCFLSPTCPLPTYGCRGAPALCPAPVLVP